MMMDRIPVPAIDGLEFRRLQDADDYAGMAAVRTGSVAWDRVDLRSSREGIPTATDLAGMFPLSELRHHPDLLIVTMHGRVIGYSHVRWRWTEEADGRVYLHLGYLLPEWRGRGIGTAMLAWSQERIRALASEERATDGFERAVFATNASSTEREATALIEEAGYAVVRRLSDMARPPAAPERVADLAPEFTHRPLVPDAYRPMYDAWTDAYANVWAATPPSEEEYREFVHDHFGGEAFDPAWCAVAWAGDEVAGFVVGRITVPAADARTVGVIAEVSVRPRWRRRGLARALVQRVLTTLADRNPVEIRLYTDAENGQGARSLYESLGFREVKQHLLYRKPLDG